MTRSIAALTLVLALAATASADEIKLRNGDVLNGTIIETSKAGVTLDHPILGRIYVSRSNVAGETGTTAPAGDLDGEAAATTSTPAAKTNPWKLSAELGASGTSGNSDTDDLHAAINGLLEDDAKRWAVGAGYSTSESNDVETKDQWFAEVTRDWKFAESKWFLFAGARYDDDNFQEWDHRTTLKAGAGYQWLERNDLNVRFRAGLTHVNESGIANPLVDDSRVEGLLGGEAVWKLTEAQTITAGVTYYPDFDDNGEFRTVSELGWSMKLATETDVRLKVGLKNEYDSHRDDPFDTTDRQYFVALLFAF